MSKRRNMGIHQGSSNEPDVEAELHGPAETPVVASPQVMAGRKIAVPKSRRSAMGSTGTGSPITSSITGNGVFAGMKSNPPTPGNPFASSSGLSESSEASDSSSKPFSFLTSNSLATPPKPAFSFGYSSSPANVSASSPTAVVGSSIAPTPASAQVTAPKPATATAQVAAPAAASSNGSASSNADFVKYLKIRALNEKLREAIDVAIKKNALADLSPIVDSYKAYYSKIDVETRALAKEAQEFAQLKDEPVSKPSSGFSFGAPATSVSMTTALSSDSAPKFSFGSSAGVTKSDSALSKPSISVSSISSSTPALTGSGFGFGSPSDKADSTSTVPAAKSGFSFGSTTSVDSTSTSSSFTVPSSLSAKSTVLEDKPTSESTLPDSSASSESKEAIAFKPSTPGFSFSSTAASSPFKFGSAIPSTSSNEEKSSTASLPPFQSSAFGKLTKNETTDESKETKTPSPLFPFVSEAKTTVTGSPIKLADPKEANSKSSGLNPFSLSDSSAKLNVPSGSSTSAASAPSFKFNVAAPAALTTPPTPSKDETKKTADESEPVKVPSTPSTPFGTGFTFQPSKGNGNNLPVFGSKPPSSPATGNVWTPDRAIKFGSAPATDEKSKNQAEVSLESTPAKSTSITATTSTPAPFSFGSSGFGSSTFGSGFKPGSGFGTAVSAVPPAPSLGFPLFSSSSAAPAPAATVTTTTTTTPDAPAFSFNANSEFKLAAASGPTVSSIFATAPSSTASVSINSAGEAGTSGDAEDGDAAPPEQQIDLSAEKGPGEENEDIVISGRAKVFQFKTVAQMKEDRDSQAEQGKDTFVSLGVGPYRVLKHQTTSKTRVLVRADGGGRVLLNVLLRSKVDYVNTGPNVRILDFTAENKGVTYLIKVKTAEDASKLASALNENKG
ncbi:uncharacterized protein V1516DRAFT_686943 [Lipomyces oligophaga]|uniref:uncharacterized protein n=1 Tax=Lipomyces oligophaga TaxID=45792 RepID=UPI0034CFAE9D